MKLLERYTKDMPKIKAERIRKVLSKEYIYEVTDLETGEVKDKILNRGQHVEYLFAIGGIIYKADDKDYRWKTSPKNSNFGEATKTECDYFQFLEVERLFGKIA